MDLLYICTTVHGDEQTYHASSFSDAYIYLLEHEADITWINFQRVNEHGEALQISGARNQVMDAIGWLQKAEHEANDRIDITWCEWVRQGLIKVREQNLREARCEKQWLMAEAHARAKPSLEEVKAFLDDLRQLCERHDICITATCDAEGLPGEIKIGRLSAAKSYEWWNEYMSFKFSDNGDWELRGNFPSVPGE